ncbi:MAG: alanine--tRNA ligase [Maricaulaceae bacterium]|jgi:alanyl-tRNA synthetase
MVSSVNDIRSTFLDYFAREGHEPIASGPLVPRNDPTLMFTNAGMVQFKDYFTGRVKPHVPRAVTAQKVVRAGGKHNDLDNVGYTARHHTFFEMLGNFSFGDYFKEKAIKHAWDLVTGTFELPAEKLLVTVYAEDDAAFDLWKKIAGLPDEKIVRIATSDNFWSMGETGPCGPCSEIFYDHGANIPGGPPGSPDEDGDRWVEIWNLVFMQYDQQPGGERIDLPKPSIDTGMGLERMAAVLQGVHSNYDIDLFKTLIAASVEATGRKAKGEDAASHRVIADHLRACSFLIADGVGPSNEGRGYVLRRIMRRAMRHAHHLGAEEPLMHRLAPTLADAMGDAYPELRRALPAITETLRQEEERFQRTLGRGLALLDEAAAGLKKGDVLAGETAFKLYDTYGFPLDLTEDALRPRGIGVDTAGFDAAMERQQSEARASWKGSGDKGAEPAWLKLREGVKATKFVGYDDGEAEGTIVAIVQSGAPVDEVKAGHTAEVVFDRTPFYAESGGQIGDTGSIAAKAGAASVLDTQKRAGDLHAHVVEVKTGVLKVGDKGRLKIDAERRAATVRNHSATHLLHAALRRVLGPHVTQKGSYVGPDRLRFDFSHGSALTADEMASIEAEVNAVIRDNAETSIREMAPDKAIEAGALALFGEKYGETVRVLGIGGGIEDRAKPYSVELCGGAHVRRAGDIALFKVIGESAVAAGVRRIEALTGEAARLWLEEQAGLARTIADALKVPVADAPTRLVALLDERKRLERELAEAKKKLALGGASGGGAAASQAPEDVGGVKLIARVLEGVGGKDLRSLVDEAKADVGSGVAAFVGVADGKAALAIGVTKDLSDRIDARELVKAGAAAVGGKGGGGRPDMAQAGGPDGAKAEDALAAIRAALEAATQVEA